MQCQLAPRGDTDDLAEFEEKLTEFVHLDAVLNNRDTVDLAEFEERLRELINVLSLENGSDTPDFILAEYLGDCLRAWNVWGPTLPYTYREIIVALGSAIDSAQEKREKWFGTPSDTDGGPQN